MKILIFQAKINVYSIFFNFFQMQEEIIILKKIILIYQIIFNISNQFLK